MNFSSNQTTLSSIISTSSSTSPLSTTALITTTVNGGMKDVQKYKYSVTSWRDLRYFQVLNLHTDLSFHKLMDSLYSVHQSLSKSGSSININNTTTSSINNNNTDQELELNEKISNIVFQACSSENDHLVQEELKEAFINLTDPEKRKYYWINGSTSENNKNNNSNSINNNNNNSNLTKSIFSPYLNNNTGKSPEQCSKPIIEEIIHVKNSKTIQLLLNWKCNSNVQEYTLLMKSSKELDTFSIIYRGHNSFYTTPDLEIGIYNFKVKATNRYGVGEFSKELEINELFFNKFLKDIEINNNNNNNDNSDNNNNNNNSNNNNNNNSDSTTIITNNENQSNKNLKKKNNNINNNNKSIKNNNNNNNNNIKILLQEISNYLNQIGKISTHCNLEKCEEIQNQLLIFQTRYEKLKLKDEEQQSEQQENNNNNNNIDQNLTISNNRNENEILKRLENSLDNVDQLLTSYRLIKEWRLLIKTTITEFVQSNESSSSQLQQQQQEKLSRVVQSLSKDDLSDQIKTMIYQIIIQFAKKKLTDTSSLVKSRVSILLGLFSERRDFFGSSWSLEMESLSKQLLNEPKKKKKASTSTSSGNGIPSPPPPSQSTTSKLQRNQITIQSKSPKLQINTTPPIDISSKNSNNGNSNSNGINNNQQKQQQLLPQQIVPEVKIELENLNTSLSSSFGSSYSSSPSSNFNYSSFYSTSPNMMSSASSSRASSTSPIEAHLIVTPPSPKQQQQQQQLPQQQQQQSYIIHNNGFNFDSSSSNSSNSSGGSNYSQMESNDCFNYQFQGFLTPLLSNLNQNVNFTSTSSNMYISQNSHLNDNNNNNHHIPNNNPNNLSVGKHNFYQDESILQFDFFNNHNHYNSNQYFNHQSQALEIATFSYDSYQ